MGSTNRPPVRRHIAVPLVIGLLALVLAVGLSVWTLSSDSGQDEGEAADDASRAATDQSPTASGGNEATKVATTWFEHRRGGFKVRVPADYQTARNGVTGKAAAPSKDVVVTFGPGEAGRPEAASKAFLKRLRQTYSDVRVAGSEQQRINGRPSVLRWGAATNSHGAEVRFVTAAVRATPRNYTLVAYTGVDAQAVDALPRVNAIFNSFTVLD